MAVTIKDVAQLAGVSHQTVSRVINNTSNVRPETRKKVMDAIEKLQFYPNKAAQNLQKQVVSSIGLFIPFSSEQIRGNPFFAEIIGVISNVCTKQDMCLNIFSYDENKDGIDLPVRLYKQKIIGGLILTCPSIDKKNIIELKYHRIPFVVIGRPVKGYDISYVDIDNVKLAYDCTKVLIELGHRNIALINGPSFMTYSQDIYTGYCKALNERGLNINSDIIVETNLLEEDAETKAVVLFQKGKNISAIFTANDYLALGIMKVAFDRGLKVPEDISIIAGCENRWNSFVTPALSSVRIDYTRLGEEAAKSLFDLMFSKQEETKRVIIPTEIVMRGSCRRIS